MTETSSRTPGWIKALLVVSLVANVAIVGVFAGSLMKEEKKHRGPERHIQWILKFVPEHRREHAEKMFEPKREQIRKLYRERNQNMDAIVAAIRAEPFAPETLAAAIRDRRQNSADRRMLVEDTLVELMATFSQDERAAFADAMEERLEKWKKKRQAK